MSSMRPAASVTSPSSCALRFPSSNAQGIGDWLYGCNVCQEVCPWNRKESPGPIGFPHDATLEWLDPVELLGLDAEAFRVRFKNVAVPQSPRRSFTERGHRAGKHWRRTRTPRAGKGNRRSGRSRPRRRNLGDRPDSGFQLNYFPQGIGRCHARPPAHLSLRLERPNIHILVEFHPELVIDGHGFLAVLFRFEHHVPAQQISWSARRARKADRC